MRLKVVETGHREAEKQFLEAVAAMMRQTIGPEADAPDVIRTGLYRPELFGRPYGDLLQDVMRGPSEWSPGERELFAAFVSRQNQCPF